MPEIPEKSLQKLEKMLAIIDGVTLTHTDFMRAFQKVIDVVLQTQKQQQEAINRLEETYKMFTEKIREDHTTLLIDHKGQINQLFVDQLKRMNIETKTSLENLKAFVNSQVDKKMRDMDNGISRLNESEKTLKTNSENSAKILAAAIDLKIKEMDGHKSSKDEAVDNLKKEMEKIKDILANIPRGRAMGRAKVPIVRAQNLTSQVDGVVNTFTLAPDTTEVLGVFSSQFPINFNAGIDWTFAGRTLTLVTAQVGVPAAGQTLWCLTEVLFSP